MDYTQARNYVDSLKQYGSILGLDTMKALMSRLGNPQDRLSVVQAAGTNGKGSVLAFLNEILVRAGYRTGKYISPAVFSYREIITYSGNPIEKEMYAALVTRIRDVCEAMVREGLPQPTVFEVETALAYLYFHEKKCDIALIETGMGGDMDATNITKRNLLAILMSISLDHTKILGDTLEEIAFHKAGIIKPGCPVVLYGQKASVQDVIVKKAAETVSELIVSNEERFTEDGGGFSYTCANGAVYDKMHLGPAGEFQKKNVLCALEAAEVLKREGFRLSSQTVREAVRKTTWQGRFEKVSEHPLCYMDGAHNPDAAKQLAETIEKHFTKRKIAAIIGILADKDYRQVLDIMVPYLAEIITVTPQNARGLDGRLLQKEVQARTSAPVVYQSSVAEAWEYACTLTDRYRDEESVILAFGSLSWLGDFREAVKRSKKEDENRR